jgi:hypothetical protein
MEEARLSYEIPSLDPARKLPLYLGLYRCANHGKWDGDHRGQAPETVSEINETSGGQCLNSALWCMQ